MEFYLQFASATLGRLLTYRFNAFFKMINRLIFMAVQVYIWKIVYGNDKQLFFHTQFGTISLHDMISYTVMSHVMYCFIQSCSVSSLNSQISSGNISQLLVRPISIKMYLFIESLCESLISVLLQALPLLIFGILVYRITIPSFLTCLLFVLFLINGFLIYYLLTTIVAASAFWVVKAGPADALVNGLIKIFSGVWIPVWFLSGWLLHLSELLPLQNIYFLPIAVYLQKLTGREIIRNCLTQGLWIAGLYLVMDLVWRKGETKVMIQGG
ncbi:MAG TPA: ABC-2 family transporter protein [Candidatus Eisenbergiella merdipullorum]|uniref:ABC-2 family transporter protein n=1 Tax=Candidatus Eisenbergiella merdipullorum TaxID=2838553 RepID=A0A9D2IAB4_9FIRM|nr:ABC-2 family transporter protein [Candidatus Eisenbergiella merdipullorum]